MRLSIKGQGDVFAKILFIVVAAIAFLLIFLYSNRFIASTTEERTSSNFRVQTLNTLQKLVTSYDCLAYVQNETPYKIVIDKNKLDDFAAKYIYIEPDCAKALDFDYNIRVVQFEHNFTLYPGEEHTTGQAQYVNSLAVHCNRFCTESWGCSGCDTSYVTYILCNFVPDSGYCSGELDGETDCPNRCWDDPSKCSDLLPTTCCVNYKCPITNCTVKDNLEGGHPYVILCNVNLSSDCSVIPSSVWVHRWCGKVAIDIPQPVGHLTNVQVEQKIWSFGLRAGVTSFSPEKAKQEELQLSLPVTIRHNNTFSAEGIIYIYVVRGELEDLISVLEDICEKAKANDTQDINFSKDFHFSYPVNYSSPTNSLCMTNSCKKFVCPYDLDFQEITNEGDYSLNFYFNSNSKKMTVKK